MQQLNNTPELLAVALAWETAAASKEQVKDVLAAIGAEDPKLHVSEIFTTSGAPPPSDQYVLHSMSSFYQGHYAVYVATGGGKYTYFDDSLVVTDLDWKGVTKKSVDGRWQPQLLLYRQHTAAYRQSTAATAAAPAAAAPAAAAATAATATAPTAATATATAAATAAGTEAAGSIHQGQYSLRGSTHTNPITFISVHAPSTPCIYTLSLRVSSQHSVLTCNTQTAKRNGTLV